jgi:hypothetical protein
MFSQRLSSVTPVVLNLNSTKSLGKLKKISVHGLYNFNLNLGVKPRHP